MTTRIPANVRWVGVAIVLLVASSIGSQWRQAPSASLTISTSLVRLVPPIFNLVPPIVATASARQLPTEVCQKQPEAGEVMNYILNSASATAGGVQHTITSEATSVNFSGLDGTPTNLFAENVPLPAGNYTGLSGEFGDVISANGAITCDVDGAGPIPTRTYYTLGNPDKTVADGIALDPDDAAPVLTNITIDSGVLPFQLPVAFTVTAGASTTLRLGIDTDQGFRLWDISVLTGVADSYKIIPGDITITAGFVVP